MKDRVIENLETIGFQIEQVTEYHYRITMFSSHKMVDLWVNNKGLFKWREGGKTQSCWAKDLPNIINHLFI